MSFGERKEARHLYDAMCDGTDDPLTEDQLKTLGYIFEKEGMQNGEALEQLIKSHMEYVPKPVAEARAIGSVVAGSMQMSEIAPRLYYTAIKLQEENKQLKEQLKNQS